MVAIAIQRKRVNLTQGELAKKLGVTQGAVSQWENGTTSPDIRLLVRLASVLECTVDELLTGESTTAHAK